MGGSLAKSDTPEENSPEDGERGPVIYLTALSFPPGVDWRNGDFRFGEILLFRGNEIVARAPAGDNPYYERHRVRDGSLWSESIDGKNTCIMKDGKELFRYEGEELLMGFLPTEEGLYTLGQKPGSGGLSFRKDGVELFSDPSGTIVGSLAEREWEGGALCLDSGSVFYSYSVPIQKGERLLREYRTMKGDMLYCRVDAGSAGTVYDIKVRGSTVWRVEKRTALSTSFCMVCGGEYHSLEIFAGEEPSGVKLVPHGEGVRVKGYSTNSGASPMFWYRGISMEDDIFVSSNYIIPDLYVEGEDTAWFQEHEGLLVTALKNWIKLPLPEGPYCLKTPLCACLHDGVLYAALTALEPSQKNVLFIDGEHVEYDFNGYFTSVRF